MKLKRTLCFMLAFLMAASAVTSAIAAAVVIDLNDLSDTSSGYTVTGDKITTDSDNVTITGSAEGFLLELTNPLGVTLTVEGAALLGAILSAHDLTVTTTSTGKLILSGNSEEITSRVGGDPQELLRVEGDLTISGGVEIEVTNTDDDKAAVRANDIYLNNGSLTASLDSGTPRNVIDILGSIYIDGELSYADVDDFNDEYPENEFDGTPTSVTLVYPEPTPPVEERQDPGSDNPPKGYPSISMQLISGSDEWIAAAGYLNLNTAVFKITNDGNADLTGVSVSLYYDLGAFDILGSFPAALAAGESFEISVRPKNDVMPRVSWYDEEIVVAAVADGVSVETKAFVSLYVYGPGMAARPSVSSRVGQQQPGGQTGQPSAWSADVIKDALKKGLVPPYLAGKYQNTLYRNEFCALAVRLYERVSGKGILARQYFDDTTDVNVQKLAGLGLIGGDGEGSFNPNGEFTREMAYTLMYNMMVHLGYEFPDADPDFEDADKISPNSKKAIGALQAAGIIQGDGTNLNPGQAFTREMGIVTIMQFLAILD